MGTGLLLLGDHQPQEQHRRLSQRRANFPGAHDVSHCEDHRLKEACEAHPSSAHAGHHDSPCRLWRAQRRGAAQSIVRFRH